MESERLVVMGWLATAAMVSAAFFFGPKATSSNNRTRDRNSANQLAGLRNLGRTCYLNTILQALAACPSFIDWLRQRHNDDNGDGSGENTSTTLKSSLLTLLSVVNGVDRSIRTDILEPSAIIVALKKLGYSFSSGEEDAHHLFLALLQSLEKEIISKPKHHKGSLSDILAGTDRQSCGDDSDLLSPASFQSNNDFGVRTPDGDDNDDDDNQSNYSFGSFLPGGGSSSLMTAAAITATTDGPYFGSNPTSLSTGNLMDGPHSLYSLKKRFARKRSFRFQSYRAKPLEQIRAQLAHEHPFSGSLTSQLVCVECSRRSTVRYDKFDCVSLAFPVRTQPVLEREYELEQLLFDFVNPEVVTDVQCETCSKKAERPVLTNHRKTLYLGKLPKCLCVHLSRNEWNLKTGKMIKRLEHVKFPARLSLHDYTYLENSRMTSLPSSLSSWSNGGTSCDLKFGQLYQLVAVVVHTGTAESGHFITYRRGTNDTINNWYFTSDCEIRQVAAEIVYKSTAYMLFYEKLTFKNYMQFANGDNDDDLFN